MLCRMIMRFLFVLAALLLPTQAMAQDHAAGLDGHWALRIDEATIFVFTLDKLDDGSWQGAWTRPSGITSNGMVFRQMSGRETVQPLEVTERSEIVQLTFAGPEADGRRDVLQFRQTSENQAELNYVGIPGAPYPLVRVLADTPLGPFDEVRIYDRDNAVTETEFVELVEPVEAPEPIDALAPLDEAELAVAEDAVEDAAEEEDDDLPRITADFLDGL